MAEHRYNEIIAETDARRRSGLLAKEFRSIVVPRACATVHRLLEEVTTLQWRTDPTFFGEDIVEPLGDGWWLCTACSEGFEAGPCAMCCPSCDRPLVACGLEAALGAASILLVAWGARTAIRVSTAETSYFGFPRSRSVGWGSRPNDGEPVEPDAWALALSKLVLGEDELRRGKIDASTIFEVFELQQDGGYFHNEELVAYLQTAPLDELIAIAGFIRDRFTFLPGGGWCPAWLDGDRLHGSPLMILGPLLRCMRRRSPPEHSRWVAALLGYVLADRDVFDHDELAVSHNLGTDLVNLLMVAPREDFDADALEVLLAGTERAVSSATGVEYGIDLFGLLLRLLSWDLSVGQRARAIAAVLEFGSGELGEADVLEAYLDTDVVSAVELANYATQIADLPETTSGSPLDDLCERMRR